jgi:hypothetical protein
VVRDAFQSPPEIYQEIYCRCELEETLSTKPLMRSASPMQQVKTLRAWRDARATRPLDCGA